MDIISLIIQAVGGVAGGNAAGKGIPNADLGPLGNTVAGAIGGAGGGQLLQALIPALAGATRRRARSRRDRWPIGRWRRQRRDRHDHRRADQEHDGRSEDVRLNGRSGACHMERWRGRTDWNTAAWILDVSASTELRASLLRSLGSVPITAGTMPS